MKGLRKYCDDPHAGPAPAALASKSLPPDENVVPKEPAIPVPTSSAECTISIHPAQAGNNDFGSSFEAGQSFTLGVGPATTLSHKASGKFVRFLLQRSFYACSFSLTYACDNVSFAPFF
jgi:hypothetical protein